MNDTDTGEPDEFARLLAQLNGTAEQPTVAAPTAFPPAPVFTPPPAPAMPPPAMPAPADVPAPVPPMPAAQAPIAPAFGVTSPYPAHVATQTAAPAPGGPAPLTFPPVAPLPAAAAPVAPSLPRAPELMGADELAAPPRTFPPVSEPAPPLVSPPEYPARPLAADAVPPESLPTYEPQLPSAPPQSPQFASAPAPSAPTLFAPESALPAPSVASAAGMPPAPASPAQASPSASSAARAPLDFASLLATPVGVDDDSVAAAAPLRFGSSSSDDDDGEPDVGRSTTAEKIGLVLAVVVAPIGLIVGIVAAARSVQRRGWVVGIVRGSIAIAAVLTVAIGIGGYFEYTQLKQQQAHDQIAAASAAFCATIKANPSMDQLPTLGWPGVAASIPDSLKAMQAYEDRWTKLAKVSPAGIKPGVTRVAAAAKKIIDTVTGSRTVDDASNIADMSAAASSSGVPEWHSQYCG